MAVLQQLVVTRLEIREHLVVDLEAALARDLEIPGVALLVDLVELHEVRIVPAHGPCLVGDVRVLHREDRIIEPAVSEVVGAEFLQCFRISGVLRPDGTSAKDEGEVHHFRGFDRLGEVQDFVHTELLGLALLAIKHLLLAFCEFHFHDLFPIKQLVFAILLKDYPLRVMVIVAFSPTSGASISTMSPFLIVVIGSWSHLSTAGISAAMAPLISKGKMSRQMKPTGP